MRPPHRAVAIRICGSMIAAILIFVGVVSKNLVSVTSALSLQTTPKPHHHNDHRGGDPTSHPQPTRRDLLLRTAPALIVPTTLLLSNPNLAAATENDPSPLASPTRQDVPAVDATTTPRTYVITGATSGIGLAACQRLARSGPQNTIVLVGRTLQRAQEAVDAVVAHSSTGTTTTTAQLIPAECDLASLQSIDQFANDFLKGTTTIDTLCLNAGLCRNTNAKDCVRTNDGYELTVGVNHFGHFYLTHLLLPRLNANDGKIVVTASGVHDPDSPGGAQGETATLGDLDGLARFGRGCEMIDGGPFNADKAYKDSKLCNVLFTRELQRRLSLEEKTKNIVVNCFNPGLIVSTGLFRDQNQVFTKLFDFAATDLFKVGETIEWGGGALAYVTTLSTRGQYYTSPPGSSKYGNDAYGKQFAVTQVSKEAQDMVKGQRLWELTAQSLGIAA